MSDETEDRTQAPSKATPTAGQGAWPGAAQSQELAGRGRLACRGPSCWRSGAIAFFSVISLVIRRLQYPTRRRWHWRASPPRSFQRHTRHRRSPLARASRHAARRVLRRRVLDPSGHAESVVSGLPRCSRRTRHGSGQSAPARDGRRAEGGASGRSRKPPQPSWRSHSSRAPLGLALVPQIAGPTPRRLSLARAVGQESPPFARGLAVATLFLGLIDFAIQFQRFETLLRLSPDQHREDMPACRRRRPRPPRFVVDAFPVPSGWIPPEILASLQRLILTGPSGLTVVLAGGPPLPRSVSLRSIVASPAGEKLRQMADQIQLPQVPAPSLARHLAQRRPQLAPLTADLVSSKYAL